MANMKKALDNAVKRGYAVGIEGKPNKNPYKDIRTTGNRVTGSRAFWNAWDAGWRQGVGSREFRRLVQ